MKNLCDKELMNVEGGGLNLGIAALVGMGISFLIGVVDGIFRPFRCR